MIFKSDLTGLISTLRSEARAAHQRRMIIVSGAQNWCRQIVQMALSGNELQNTALWIADRAPADTSRIDGRRASALLGQENTVIVFDAYCGFDPDAFGAVAGTITGGGLLFLLTPPLTRWPSLADPEYARITVYPYQTTDINGRFLKRLSRIIQSDSENTTLIRQHLPLPVLTQTGRYPPKPADHTVQTGTHDQNQAIAAIIKVVTGHRRRPLVITSNRGRGKSSAFGIAAAKLLQLGYHHILVTGPQFAAVQPVFEHARQLLPEAKQTGPVLRYGGQTDEKMLQFIAPDELLRTAQTADLLLVDEAAAIPASLLQQLLDRYARIAFATTVHGYEGSGRGFSLRFNKVLDQRTPGWKNLQLQTPIRWAAGDPLERFVFRALLLDAAPAAEADIREAKSEDCIIERLDRDQLAGDESTLRQLFGLLVLAHYRTRPYDLRHLLDGPNLEIYVMRYRQSIVATALVAIEGKLDAAIANAIYQGYRRLQGHLIPQTLIAQLALPAAANMTGARIMRIAVHPVLQRRGFGTRLLTYINERISGRNYDWIGSSFGVTPELLNFWTRLGQLPVRLGFSRETSSGAHSLLVLQPLTGAATDLFRIARLRFLDSLPYLLAEPLNDFDPQLAALILTRNAADSWLTRSADQGLSASEWCEIEAFAFHQRNYEDSILAIWKMTTMILRDQAMTGVLGQQEQMVLIGKVLQKRSWQNVAALAGANGRRQAITVMRQAFRTLHAYFHTGSSGE